MNTKKQVITYLRDIYSEWQEEQELTRKRPEFDPRAVIIDICNVLGFGKKDYKDITGEEAPHGLWA